MNKIDLIKDEIKKNIKVKLITDYGGNVEDVKLLYKGENINIDYHNIIID